MSPERRKKVQALYDSALKQDRTHRSSFLDQACEGDDELRGEVEGLLAQQSPDLTLTLIGIGTQLGPYRIESLIGAGGMGEVYRAVDTRLGRRVAVKLVRPDMANRPEFRERLLREARAISALNHPHICTLYDVGEHDGLSHLVMEYVEGETLSARLRQGPLPIDLVLRYGIEIASALATAHARGIVHRDLKPANLIVTAFGIKVLDFGLAKSAAAAADAPLEASGAHRVVGTPAYMSPEQSRGERLDGRTDIFSLGCVLYQAATGIAPFRGASVMAILHEVATGMPVRPSSVRPELPQEFDAVLERALAKERDLRYASAADLEQALIALQSPLRVTAAQECEPEPLIGRERELQKLEGLLGRATEGTGGMVLLMGEPGIGKTALAGSFLYSAVRRHPDLLVGRGACVEQYGAGEAYLPFLDALSGLLTGSGRERVIGVLRRQAPTWCLQFPAVFTGSSVDNLQLETIGANKERMLRELGDALGELASASPIVLLLEDLHWADTSSVDLLRHLGQRLRRGASGTRMLIMGTARPEELERENHPLRNCKRELEGHGVCEEIALRELPEQQVWHYLDLHFSPHSFPPDFARLIYRKTEGHPLFLTGALQFLTEHGEVVQSNGVWSLAKPVSGLDLQVPESVHNMLRKQLEVLPAEDRKTLQYASIEGEEFTSVVLAELLGVEELELEERLAAIEKVHRLIRTRGEEELPDGSLSNRYRFAHALYQNILYQDLLNKRRILLHRQAGEVLARRYGTETGQIAMALAAHFERGRDLPRAIQHLIHAADVAQSRYASETAEELCSRALLLSERLQPEERMQAEIALLNKRGRHRITTVHLPEAVSDFTAMLERARAAADPVHECMALIGLAWTSFGTHAIESNQANAHAALTIAERIGHKGLQDVSWLQL